MQARGRRAAGRRLRRARRRRSGSQALDWRGSGRDRGRPGPCGVLTEAFDWRAIFIVQAPIALAAAPALMASHIATVRESLPRPPKDLLAGLALALLSGALTALVFLLVLLLISGWSVEPLAAAAAVSVLPLAAIAGSFLRGAASTRAVGGCLLVAGGISCLALMQRRRRWDDRHSCLGSRYGWRSRRCRRRFRATVEMAARSRFATQGSRSP